MKPKPEDRIPVMIDDSPFEGDDESPGDPGAMKSPLTWYEIEHPELQVDLPGDDELEL